MSEQILDSLAQRLGRVERENRRSLQVVSMVLVFGLAGCAFSTLRRQQEAQLYSQQIITECRSKRLRGELSGHVASVLCSNDRIRQVWAESGYPYMDLIDLQLAYRMALAKRIDEGALSEEDTQLQLAELASRVNTEVQRRNVMAQQAHSQRLQSIGALLQGLAAWEQSQSPPALAAPRPINCYQYGNFIQCN